MSLFDRIDVLQKVLSMLPVGVWIVDSTSTICYGNPAAQKIWGGARYVDKGQYRQYKAWWLATGEEIKNEEWAAYRAISKGETTIDEEIEIEAFDGSRKIILNSAMPIHGEDNTIEGAIIVNIDITRRKRVEMKLRDISEHDHLTNTYNRRHMYKLLGVEIERARRYQTPLSMVMFDIDHFKSINDTYGHIAGDTILVGIVEAVQKELRTSDLLARFGGEEFIVILPGIDAAAATMLAERLRHLIPQLVFEFATGITCSFGVCQSRDDDDIDTFIRRVDHLLYKAKHAGRNCVMTE